ncbi:hypothetical protein SAMN03159463_03758 [Mesorhizobium sp. NFR06]|uniref:hypothetical protein n=1 Tax=Mesorhizobium sp. NFR06 TaxID=1566290 RepID=UPI0008E28D7D|nr:hypothetical protein [Mesorhizobium sp. NFR06]SFP17434.1 hypothetical protein SAMN03159463_03758 [Mesorhizobium sp. NFR06]
MSKSHEFFAVGCIPFQGDRTGFALPILRTVRNPQSNFVQEIDELTGKIARFLELGDIAEKIILSSSDLAVKAGDEQVLAFVTEDGLCHIGTAGAISPILRSFVVRFPERHSVALQIAELIGDAHEKKRARVAMREQVAKATGARSARAYYEGSALRSAVWANLLAAAPSGEVARRILGARARIGASVNADGGLQLHLEALAQSDRALIDEERLKRAILAEFAIVSGETGDRGPSSIDGDRIQTGRVTELLTRVRHAPRQEERIAILISGILDNKSVGTSALLQYGRDRAKFANRALEKVREYLVQTNIPSKKLGLPAAKLVSDLYEMQYPANRGSFLMYFAKHLSKWPEINREIETRLFRTRSIFVEYLRPTIEEFLGKRSSSKEANFDLPLFASRTSDDPSK